MSHARIDTAVWGPSYPALVLTVACVGLFVLAAYTHGYAVAAAVFVAQLVLASTPPPVGGDGRPLVSSRIVPIGLGSVVATGLTAFPGLLSGAEGTRGSGSVAGSGTLSGVGVGIAVVALAALLAQMTRSDGRAELVTSLTDTVSLGVLATFLAGWAAAASAFDGRAVIGVSASALVVTALLWGVRGSRWLLGAGAVLLSAVAGVVGALYLSDVMSATFGALVGLTVGLFGWLGRAVAHEWRPRASLRWGVEGVLPIAFAAPVVFVAGQMYGV